MAITGAPELLIVMGAAATSEQVDDVVARLQEAGCAALVTPGREAMACARSIISSDVTHTGHPGPCTSSISEGKTADSVMDR